MDEKIMDRKTINKQFINDHKGKWLPFGSLLETHQKALIVYSFGCSVQWKDLSRQDIMDFQKEEKKRQGLYGIATIPMKVATEECMRCFGQEVHGYDRDQKVHGSFELYHKWYINNDPTDERLVFHKEMWPVILSPYDDEWLQDGWHRFHSYYAQKQKKVPILMYPLNRSMP